MRTAGEIARRLELCGGLQGVSEDGRVWVRAAGRTQTAGIYKDSGARGDNNEGDHRGRPGVGNDGRGWVRTAGGG